jgi:hypothetical protein
VPSVSRLVIPCRLILDEGLLSFWDLAEKMDAVPWDVLTLCRDLGRSGFAHEGTGKSRGSLGRNRLPGQGQSRFQALIRLAFRPRFFVQIGPGNFGSDPPSAFLECPGAENEKEEKIAVCK